MSKKNGNKLATYSLPPTIIAKLDELHQATGKSRSAIVAMLIARARPKAVVTAALLSIASAGCFGSPFTGVIGEKDYTSLVDLDAGAWYRVPDAPDAAEDAPEQSIDAGSTTDSAQVDAAATFDSAQADAADPIDAQPPACLAQNAYSQVNFYSSAEGYGLAATPPACSSCATYTCDCITTEQPNWSPDHHCMCAFSTTDAPQISITCS